eukprot:scaffold225923_cov40-Prasinocladus_malaysianus.AAC.1
MVAVDSAVHTDASQAHEGAAAAGPPPPHEVPTPACIGGFTLPMLQGLCSPHVLKPSLSHRNVSLKAKSAIFLLPPEEYTCYLNGSS